MSKPKPYSNADLQGLTKDHRETLRADFLRHFHEWYDEQGAYMAHTYQMPSGAVKAYHRNYTVQLGNLFGNPKFVLDNWP